MAESEVLSLYSESKKKKKCEMIFGIISIDNLGYYRVFKNITLTFYDLYTYNADSKKYDFLFTFIKKDLQDIIDVEEPLYSYLSTSIDHRKQDANALKKTSVKGDIINIDISIAAIPDDKIPVKATALFSSEKLLKSTFTRFTIIIAIEINKIIFKNKFIT